MIGKYERDLCQFVKINWINRNLLKNLLMRATVLHAFIEQQIDKNPYHYEAYILVEEYRENKLSK